MAERHLGSKVVEGAFFAMLLYWILCTKSGRVCFILFFILCMLHSCFGPDPNVKPSEVNTRWGQCMLQADKTWGTDERHAAVVDCYAKYADDGD